MSEMTLADKIRKACEFEKPKVEMWTIDHKGKQIPVVNGQAFKALAEQEARLQSILSALIECVEALEKTNFVLQCMIINKNGSVPTMTDEQVFDCAIDQRESTKKAIAKLERIVSEGSEGV